MYLPAFHNLVGTYLWRQSVYLSLVFKAHWFGRLLLLILYAPFNTQEPTSCPIFVEHLHIQFQFQNDNSKCAEDKVGGGRGLGGGKDSGCPTIPQRWHSFPKKLQHDPGWGGG